MTKKQFPLSPLSLSPRVTCLPVVHGSGAYALSVRKWLLEHPCDCLAVGLPESFRYSVLDAIGTLPNPALVLQRPLPDYGKTWQAGSGDCSDPADPFWSYVPIDPCQPMIMALRVAMGEHWDIEFCDLETNDYQPMACSLPDPYALKTVAIERFATAVLPSIGRPPHAQITQRLQYMAWRLKRLEKRYHNIVIVCSILEWPWLKEAYSEPTTELPEHDSVEVPTTYSVNPNTLLFMLGELPFLTGLYEQARARLEADENLAIDGVKHLLMSARSSYLQDFGKRARKITPLMLKQCLKYIRNLSLMENRMTPDMYTIGLASQQILGDQFTIHLVETARNYPFYDEQAVLEEVTMGIDQLRLPDGETVNVVSRLPGQPMCWRSLELRRKPLKDEIEKWKMRWDPYSQCSWPPDDKLIESFRTRVADRAQAIVGADLARSEKFSTSIKDGIDIRETLRHWYDGDIYVKVMPPSVGKLDCVLMLFDTPADPREYTWRTTWFAEHQNESTLAFFATDFSKEMIGPGIAMANYGGALFLFPPVRIPDIWRDPRFNFADDLEERLIAAACFHSRQRRLALLSPKAPGARWRRIARRYHKQLIHVPLSQFNEAMTQQLRMVHVLNGQQVRTYAEYFIRKA
jgi:hypothetical protein